ncbi:MAG: hypothetical protein AUK00_05280 [Dehalococcoidia bacterium CG2_30_46_9]|nr:MAG: hypothetical protein AUK00_05280 [Dehalococcoidia bacterium CG2_30_46_9]
MTLSQKLVLAIIRLLCKIFLSWEVKGKENLSLSGPFIVTANHVHLLDPILLAVSFPRWINFMGKEELFRSPFLRLIIRWSGTFSAHRQGTIKEKQKVLRQAKDILDRGLILGMFPEGSRSRDGKLRMGKPGSAVIASQSSIFILPVGIVGTDKIKGMSWLWKRPSIVINVGEPFKLPPIGGKLNRSQRKSLTDLMMRRIAILLPPESRGVYLNNKANGN